MNKIEPIEVKNYLNQHRNQPMYLHVETTNGAYASHYGGVRNVGVFVRNTRIVYNHAEIKGHELYRIGLKLENGWAYGEGLSHYLINEKNQLLLAGHDEDGRLAVAFQLSPQPFA